MPEYTKKDPELESNPLLDAQVGDRVPETQLSPKTGLWELAIVFAKLGAIAFGGPAAHIAQIELEIVQRRQWLSREKLLDLLGVTSLIPGPNSTELTIHIGLERAGWRGAIVAGVCFITPAMLLVWGLAIVYVEYQTIPAVGWLLYGVKPVIIAIIAQAVWKLGRSALKNIPTWCAGILVLALYFLKINEIALMLGAGITVSLVHNLTSFKKNKSLSIFLFPFSFFSFPLSQDLDSSISKLSQNWFCSLWQWLCTISFCATRICRSHSLANFTAIIRCCSDRAVYSRACIYDRDFYWLSCCWEYGCDRRDDWYIFTSVYSRSIDQSICGKITQIALDSRFS